MQSARRLFQAGGDAVKLEGGAAQAEKIRAIVDAGIPVVGHIGLLPQKVLEEGGYKIKGDVYKRQPKVLLRGCRTTRYSTILDSRTAWKGWP